MRRVFVSVLIFLGAAPAMAQVGGSPWEFTQDAEAALVIAPGGSSEGQVERESALYEVGLGLSAERTFQSGWTLGGRVVFRAARDHPARPGGSGNVLGAGDQSPAGAFSRLSTGPELEETGERGSLETAYVFLDTGYGEFSLGRDTGVAARFHEGDVSAISRASLINPYLDVSGIGAIETRPNITGPSTKASYVTPRLLGVRAGVSYTPRADVRGLDRDATGSTVPPRPELENVVEFGLNASRRLRTSGVRLRGGVSWSSAELEAPPGFADVYADRLEVFAAGGEVEWDDTYRLGMNWLSGEEGLERGGDYTAWSAGLGYERGDWRASLTYGESEIDSARSGSKGVSVAVARKVNDFLDLAVSWQDRDISPERSMSPELRPLAAKSQGIVIEITLSFEN